MVACLHKAPKNTWVLTICNRPCAGEAFTSAEKITVAGKREARKICVERDVTPHNF